MPSVTYAETLIARSREVQTVEGNLYFPRTGIDMNLLELG